MEAIILAGGLGTRLRSVVADVPKCMAPVGGKPFLWYVLRYLSRREHGVTRVILSVGHLREQVISWAEEHKREYPFSIAYSPEDEPLGTGGAIRRACAVAQDRHVASLNGDTLFDVRLDRLLATHKERGYAVTLSLKEMSRPDRYGTVALAGDGGILGFEEKAPKERGLVNGGVYVIDREAGIFPEGEEKFSFERAVLEPLAGSGGRLGGMVSDGYFIDIGIPQDYARAQTELPGMFPDSLRDIDVSRWSTLLLDRDGVINRLRPGDYVKSWSEFEFLPGAVEAIAQWTGQGKDIYVITNQRGVGRGLMSPHDLSDIHRRMTEEIERAGGRIKGIYVCTATTDDDPMRKPNTGMFERLCAEHPDVQPDGCLMIGDSAGDMQFAANCGIKGVRV